MKASTAQSPPANLKPSTGYEWGEKNSPSLRSKAFLPEYEYSRSSVSHSVVSDSATPWIAVRQAPLSMEFFRQEYWSRLPFPPPGDVHDPGIEPAIPALAGGFNTIWVTRESHQRRQLLFYSQFYPKHQAQWQVRWTNDLCIFVSPKELCSINDKECHLIGLHPFQWF